MTDPLNPPLGGRADEREAVIIHPLRFARPPVSGGQLAGAVFAVVTDSPPETGVSTRRGRGWIVFRFHFSHFRSFCLCALFARSQRPSSASVTGQESLRPLRSLREIYNTTTPDIILLTQR